jgi:hypothetical protein
MCLYSMKQFMLRAAIDDHSDDERRYALTIVRIYNSGTSDEGAFLYTTKLMIILWKNKILCFYFALFERL